MNEQSDEVEIDARPSQGTAANIGKLQREEADIVYTQDYDAVRVTEGMDPYSNVSFELNEVVHWMSSPLLFATTEDWDSITDIQPDTSVSPSSESSGTRDMLELALDYAVDDYDPASVQFTQQAGPFQEGTLDVGVIPLINDGLEPAYVQEQKSTGDLSVLQWPESAISEMEADPLVPLTEVDMTQFEGYANVPADTITTPVANFNMVARNDLEYDAIYEILEIMYDNRDSLSEYHDILSYHADIEHWVGSSYEPVPYHPAAADFFEEVGVWDMAEGGRADE